MIFEFSCEECPGQSEQSINVNQRKRKKAVLAKAGRHETTQLVQETTKRAVRENQMVNFMFQLNWAMGSPDIWAIFILGVS